MIKMKYKIKNKLGRLFKYKGQLALIIAVIFSATSCKKNIQANIKTLNPTNDQGTSITLNGTLPEKTDSAGFVLATTSGATIETGTNIPATISGNNSAATTEITPLTSYYCQAYCWVKGEVYYGKELSFTSGHKVGQYYQGGRIGYICQPGDANYEATQQHGIIVAQNQLSDSAAWGCQGSTITNTQGTEIGDGPLNTLAAVTDCEQVGIGARLCDDLIENGYDDWFMPSFGELKAIAVNYSLLGSGLPEGYYFSSTQSSPSQAWAVYFAVPPVSESPIAFDKNSHHAIVAVREF